MARSSWRTGTRPARSSCLVSAPRSRPVPRSRSELGAKRAIVLPVSVAAHSPLMAEAADGMRATLEGVDVPRSVDDAPGQRRRPADHDRLTARATELVDHLTAGRRLGRCGRADDRRRRHDLRRGRPRQGPDRSHQTHRPGCRGRPGGRSGHTRPTARSRRRRGLIARLLEGIAQHASTRLRPPRRRHRTRGHQPRRQRQGHGLVEPRQRRLRPRADHLFRHVPVRGQGGRRGPATSTPRNGWTRRPRAAASRACTSASRRPSRPSPTPASS